MAQPTPAPGARRPAAVAARQAMVIAALVVVVQSVLVTLFAWPALRIEPRDLPVVVAGPQQAATAMAGQLRARRPGAFAVTIVADGAAADEALRDRRAYAAFVLGQQGVSLHLASAASPVVAQVLQSALAEPGRAVVDVVPIDSDDPRGAGFAAGFLPLVLTSIAVGALLSLLVVGRLARLTGLVAFAVLAGLAGTAVLQYGLSALPGEYLANAGVVGLLALAMSGSVAGLAALLGRPGIGLGVVLMFMVGNPFSAVTAAPELLPQPWGQAGQLLPPGAGGTLLRSVAYFDGAGGGRSALVLACWAAAGLLLLAVGRAAVAFDSGRVARSTSALIPVAAGGVPVSAAEGATSTV